MSKLKKIIFYSAIIFFTISLMLFATSNISSTKSGLTLWATSIVPSLFPFFVATELLSKTNIPYIIGNYFKIFMKPVFNVGGEGSFAFIMGFISGYPTGAKIACDFRKNNILPKEECERLLSFTNNSGPLFIIGTIGINMYNSSIIGFLLLITHILACITVGFLFRYWKKNSSSNMNSSKNSNNKNICFSELGSIIATCISNATSTLFMIGGFIVLFSVIISILRESNMLQILTNSFTPFFNILHIPSSFISPIFIGLLEITNGISQISSIHIKAISINIIITSFILGLGGISVLLQIFSITSNTDLSIKPYIIGKFLQGVISAFYTYLLINFFPIFNFNLF